MIAQQSNDDWLLGQEVRIVRGPFEGLTGRIYEINRFEKRVRLMINLGSQDTPAELEYSQIVPTTQSH